MRVAWDEQTSADYAPTKYRVPRRSPLVLTLLSSMSLRMTGRKPSQETP